MRWIVLLGLAVVVGLGVVLVRCGTGVDWTSDKAKRPMAGKPAAKQSRAEQPVTRTPTHVQRYKDATEIPGAIVIRPQLDPNMIYDSETKRTADRRSGEYFASQGMNPINRIYQGSIRDRNGKVLLGYEYRYGGSRLANGKEKSVYEIIWSVRGEDVIGKMMHEEIAGRERAKRDSLERLASFMLAQMIGYNNGKYQGETWLADRRMDDLSGEMM